MEGSCPGSSPSAAASLLPIVNKQCTLVRCLRICRWSCFKRDGELCTNYCNIGGVVVMNNGRAEQESSLHFFRIIDGN